MKLKIIFIVNLIINVSCYFFTNQAIAVSDNGIIIRHLKDGESVTIKDLAVKTFAKLYNFTTQEQVDKLQKTYDLIIPEESDYLNYNSNKMIALVATNKDIIIGYLSVNVTDNSGEVYIRAFFVDPYFQHHGIGNKLLKYCRNLLPEIKRVVCVTNKLNFSAQKLYSNWGGKKVENPSWQKYLYKIFNIEDYIGYEFDEQVLIDFDTKQKRN